MASIGGHSQAWPSTSLTSFPTPFAPWTQSQYSKHPCCILQQVIFCSGLLTPGLSPASLFCLAHLQECKRHESRLLVSSQIHSEYWRMTAGAGKQFLRKWFIYFLLQRGGYQMPILQGNTFNVKEVKYICSNTLTVACRGVWHTQG